MKEKLESILGIIKKHKEHKIELIKLIDSISCVRMNDEETDLFLKIKNEIKNGL